MTQQPLVSIMIPTYNQAAWISRAIDSALAQDYPNKEIIVCDDHSTDGTTEVLQSYHATAGVRIVRNDTNLGRVANYRHLLYDLATGSWVLNLDGDDYLTDPQFLSRAVEAINHEPDTVFVQAGHTVTDRRGQTIRVDLPDIPGSVAVVDGKDYFLQFHHFSHLATLYNRTMARDIGFYRYDILSSDIESLLRLSLSGKVVLMKLAVGAWVQHGDNESARLSAQAVEKNMLRIEGPYRYACDKNILGIQTLKKWRRRMIRKYLSQYLAIYLRKPDRLPGYLSQVLHNHSFATICLPLAAAIVKRFRSADKG